MRSIKDFLGLYIGQRIELDQTRFSEDQVDRIFTLGGVKIGEDENNFFENRQDQFYVPEVSCWYDINVYHGGEPADKLLLRELRDMTWEECKVYYDLPKNAELIKMNIYSVKNAVEFNYRWIHEDAKRNNKDGYSYSSIAFYKEKTNWEDIAYLLKRGFDIFGLIEEGLAKNIHDVENKLKVYNELQESIEKTGKLEEEFKKLDK